MGFPAEGWGFLTAYIRPVHGGKWRTGNLGGHNCRYPLFPVPSPLGWALSVSPQAEIWNRTRDLVFKLPQNKVFRGV